MNGLLYHSCNSPAVAAKVIRKAHSVEDLTQAGLTWRWHSLRGLAGRRVSAELDVDRSGLLLKQKLRRDEVDTQKHMPKTA